LGGRSGLVIDEFRDLIFHLPFEFGDGVDELRAVGVGFLDFFDPSAGFATLL
jgi:uncharacterized protein YggL (DUF469 family)